MSAAQFVESLFGELLAFFRDEHELRRIWSRPDTRKAWLQGLSRQEQAEAGKHRLVREYDYKPRVLLEFVLAKYVSRGVDELGQEKLGALIALK